MPTVPEVGSFIEDESSGYDVEHDIDRIEDVANDFQIIPTDLVFVRKNFIDSKRMIINFKGNEIQHTYYQVNH